MIILPSLTWPPPIKRRTDVLAVRSVRKERILIARAASSKNLCIKAPWKLLHLFYISNTEIVLESEQTYPLLERSCPCTTYNTIFSLLSSPKSPCIPSTVSLLRPPPATTRPTAPTRGVARWNAARRGRRRAPTWRAGGGRDAARRRRRGRIPKSSRRAIAITR